MSWFKDSFGIQITDSACPNTYRSGGIRVSVITERLIRVEWQSEAKFCDKPTQSVLHRDLGAVHYSVARKNGMICVNTALARLIVDENTGAFKQAKVKGGFTVTDIHEGNLLGTVRTLDNVKGATKLEEGILSKNGAAMLDDSVSLTLEEDGRVLPRKKRGSDIYYFLYGHDYITAVKDFYRLTGSTPLIPRFALSNWWSRYKAYTQEEYLTLMHRFQSEEKTLNAPRKVFAGVTKTTDINKSASGGIFACVAKRIISDGGAAYGAAAVTENGDISVRCEKAQTNEELLPLLGSVCSQT